MLKIIKFNSLHAYLTKYLCNAVQNGGLKSFCRFTSSFAHAFIASEVPCT